MKVCLDVQSAITQRAGVGRYTRCLAEALGTRCGEDRLALFYFDFKRRALPFEAGAASLHPVRWMPGRVAQQAWKRFNAPAFDRFAGAADVYHFPNFILPPLRRGRSVVTIHDLAFLRFPETTEARNQAFLEARIGDTVRRADAIVTVSAFTASELCELLDVPRDKVHAIPSALPVDIREPGAEAVQAFRRRRGLDRPYLLSVGTLEPRKNYPFLVDVFEALDRSDLDLVIAGMRGWRDEPIVERFAASPRADQIRYLDYVPDEEMPLLYAGADLFMFPSKYEGFGFPPLEAMSCSTPVIAARAGSIPEVLGGAAVLIGGWDAADWAAETQRLLEDEAARERLRQAGRRRVTAFDWGTTATRMWSLYRTLAT